MEKINIPNSITDIKDRAFDCCSNVKTILLSTALLKIGNNAFDRCSSLEKVYANAKMPPMLSNKDNVFTGYDKNIVTLIVPKGSRDSYLQSDWALYFLPENIIEE